jgi:hypothetical protein
VISVLTAFVLLVWRSIVSFLLGVYQAGATVNTYKIPVLIAAGVYCGGLTAIKNQESIQILLDIAYECPIFWVQQLFNTFLQWISTQSSQTFFRYNDIVMYFRSVISDAANKIIDVNNPGSLSGVIEIIVALRDMVSGVLRIAINLPSIEIIYFTDAFNKLASLISNIWVIATDILISLAKITFTSEDCLFCGFGQEIPGDDCVLTTFAAPSVVIDCSKCHNFECDTLFQLAIFFDWITAGIDSTFWFEISDALCCVLNLWKRPVFFIIGIIQGCLDFNQLLFQLQEWGIEITNCWDNLLSVITYGQYDNIFAFLFDFIIQVIGLVIDGITDTVSCFGDDVVQECFEDFPNNCQFDSNGLPIAGLQTCFSELNTCLEIIPLYQPIVPIAFDISVYIATVFDLTTCTSVSLIQCILDASSCSGLPDCVLKIQDVLDCMSTSLPWASSFFDIIIEFLDFLLIALGSIDVVIAELEATIEQVKDAIDSSLSTLDEIAGFFGKKRGEGNSKTDNIHKELRKARELIQAALPPKITDHKILYVYHFFRCVTKGIRDLYVKDETLGNIDSFNCMKNCINDTKSCSNLHTFVKPPFKHERINYMLIVSMITDNIKNKDVKCKGLINTQYTEINHNDSKIIQDYFLCLSKYGMIFSVHNFLNNFIPIKYLSDVKPHVFFNKLKNFQTSFKMVKRTIKQSVVTSSYWNITQKFLSDYKNMNISASDERNLLEFYQDYVNQIISIKSNQTFNENYIKKTRIEKYPFPNRIYKTEPNPRFKRMNTTRVVVITAETKEQSKEKIDQFLNNQWSINNLTVVSEKINKIFYVMNKWYNIEYWPSYQTYHLFKNSTLNLNLHNLVIWAQGKKKYLVQEGWVEKPRYDEVMKNISFDCSNPVINYISGTNFLRNETMVMTIFLIGYDLENLLPSVSFISAFVRNESMKAQERKQKFKDSSSSNTTNFNDYIINILDFFIRLFGSSVDVIKDAIINLIKLVLNLDYEYFFENTLVRYLIGRATCTWPANVDGTDTYNPLCFPLVFEGIYDWITPIPNFFFRIQIPWPKEMIEVDCVKIYNGKQNFWEFQFSDDCGIIADLPFCPGCDYCPRTYKSCENRNFRDFLDSILFILAWIPWWLNILYFGGVTFLNVQIYAFPVVFILVLLASPVYLFVVIPLFYIILWLLAGLFPAFQTGFIVITLIVLIQLLFPSFFFNLQILGLLLLAVLLSWVPSLFVEYSYLTESPVNWIQSLTSFMLKTPLFMWIPGLQIIRDRTDDFIYYNNDVPTVDVVCFFFTMSNMGMAVGGGYATYWALTQSGRLIIIFVIFILDILRAIAALIGETTNNEWQGNVDRRLTYLEKKMNIQKTETTSRIEQGIARMFSKFKWGLPKSKFESIKIDQIKKHQ